MLLPHGSEELVPHLHLQHGPAQRGHGGLDVQALALEREAAAMRLLPDEALGLLLVVHLLVQHLVALLVLRVDRQAQPVLVHVVVVGHGEHDGHFLSGAVATPLEQVVGQDAHRPRGLGAGLAEVAHLGFQRAHGGLGGAVDVAAIQVNPFYLPKERNVLFKLHFINLCIQRK